MGLSLISKNNPYKLNLRQILNIPQVTFLSGSELSIDSVLGVIVVVVVGSNWDELLRINIYSWDLAASSWSHHQLQL